MNRKSAAQVAVGDVIAVEWWGNRSELRATRPSEIRQRTTWTEVQAVRKIEHVDRYGKRYSTREITTGCGTMSLFPSTMLAIRQGVAQ